MNKLQLFSEAQVREWYHEIVVLHEHLLQAEIPLNRDSILTEQEVCVLLGVTDRSLRKYRKLHHLHYIKIEGRILYLKLVLYMDLLMLGYEEKEKGQED